MQHLGTPCLNKVLMILLNKTEHELHHRMSASKTTWLSAIVSTYLYIFSGIHAREWVSPATATYIMRQLVEKYKQNSDLVDFYDFYILPVANPDG